MSITKPELYKLVRVLREVHKLPADDIGELIGRSRAHVYRIFENLGISEPKKADRIKALPVDVLAQCLVARRK